MRRLLITGLVLQVLAGDIFILQLLKTPLLIQHFRLHRENKPTGIIDFLALHYNGKEEKNDTDQREDNTLPFKSGVSADTQIVFSKTLKHEELAFRVPLITTLFSRKTMLRSLDVFSDFFQPPRL